MRPFHTATKKNPPNLYDKQCPNCGYQALTEECDFAEYHNMYISMRVCKNCAAIRERIYFGNTASERIKWIYNSLLGLNLIVSPPGITRDTLIVLHHQETKYCEQHENCKVVDIKSNNAEF